jgi:hypothetical protein
LRSGSWLQVMWGQGVRPRGAHPLRRDAAHYLKPKQGSMNTAVVRAGIVNVPVLLLNFEVRTTGSCESA